jgi:hypothetical protein
MELETITLQVSPLRAQQWEDLLKRKGWGELIVTVRKGKISVVEISETEIFDDNYNGYRPYSHR